MPPKLLLAHGSFLRPGVMNLFMKFVQLTIDAALGAKFGTNNLVVYLVLMILLMV